MNRKVLVFSAILLCLPLVACGGQTSETPGESSGPASNVERLLAQYTSVPLATDLSVLSDQERQMIPLLIEAADVMNELFWHQAFGDPTDLMSTIHDPATRQYAEINFGPWDRIADNQPFISDYGPKPPGANLYPADITKEDFEAAIEATPERAEDLRSLYTLVRHDEAGGLIAIPYSEAYAEELQSVAANLRAAAELAEDEGLRRYLELRADALLSDDYQASDMAWMDMKTNTIDVVIGPIETYEDQLFGYKAGFEAFVLIKDQDWSQRLSKYAALLPGLQRGLPVADEYKAEEPGTDSELNAYDVIYVAGDSNAGSKTIAINLPNDPEVQLAKGARRLQLKNAMRAKFDKILVPVADMLIAEDQRQLVSFDAFFANTMFHEVAHGLGIKNTIDGQGTVRQAMQEQASALEEGKADVLGLYMVTELLDQGELEGTELEQHLVTFVASIFRSIRFGAASAHGVANLVRFNFFQEAGAFTRDDATGTYRVDLDATLDAIAALSEKILVLQGDGDYEGAVDFVDQYGRISPILQQDLDRLASAGIPVDIVFEQGMDVLEANQ
jgi:hypothetical protein